MGALREPDPGNGWQADHAALLLTSYRHWTGRSLLESEPADAAFKLYHAPFVVLSHDGQPDPCFTYANLTAQTLFEMSWEDMVGMPSRYSAEPMQRVERERLLHRVVGQGYIDNYRGVRIARSKKRFLIRRATVWNLLNGSGIEVGQAATFAEWEPLPDTLDR